MKSKITNERYFIFLVAVLAIFSYQIFEILFDEIFKFKGFDSPTRVIVKSFFVIFGALLANIIPLITWRRLLKHHSKLFLWIVILSILFLVLNSFAYCYVLNLAILRHLYWYSIRISFALVIYIITPILLIIYGKKYIIVEKTEEEHIITP